MIPLHPQWVIDEKDERRAVILSVPEWEQVLEELEELDDIRAYDNAKASAQDTVPFEQAVREIQEDAGE